MNKFMPTFLIKNDIGLKYINVYVYNDVTVE